VITSLLFSAASRKSAEDSSIAELELPSVPSEERVINDGNLNKGKRKSTPRSVTY
jgi:hypothetical protein